MNNDLKSKLISGYIGVGVGIAVGTIAILVKDSDERPSAIAGYATVNGLLWPAAIVAMVMKKKELNATS